jgi:hypothetical protein
MVVNSIGSQWSQENNNHHLPDMNLKARNVAYACEQIKQRHHCSGCPTSVFHDICLDNSVNRIHAIVGEDLTIVKLVEEYDYCVNKLANMHVHLYGCNIIVTLTIYLFWQQFQPDSRGAPTLWNGDCNIYLPESNGVPLYVG